MTSKHSTLVGGAVACLIASLHTSVLQAAPWLEPGDLRARHAAQKLADRHHLDRSVTSWPMMWADFENGVRGTVAGDSESVGGALAYLRFEQSEQASPGFRAEFAAAGTTEPTFVRGFQQTQRESGTASLNAQWQGTAWALGLNPSVAADPEDDESYRLDGSYIAATTGNWVFGAGAINRWWGPGWQSSLILSNNARPIPSVWLNRQDAHAPESDWLRWVGPWQFSVFAGQLEQERAVADTKLIGMRLTFRPVDGLDIGLSRAIMLGGEGRPENGSTLWNAFIGRDNGQLGEDDPGNQLGSVDVRYGFAVGAQSMGIYGQMMGEDEAGAFPARKSWLLGLDWTSQLAAHHQQWFVEYTNTLADDFLGDAMPNITYDHSIYRSGYRYYGRSMAASFGGDAEAITLGAFNFFSGGSNLTATVSYAELNVDGANRTVVTSDDIFYHVPRGSQKVAISTLGYGTELFNGWLDVNLQVTDKDIQLLGGTRDPFSLGATWRYRF
ncbi:capsule assembly Wzi family protein [Marinobacter sp.]|uniref:capsule assembly Wzi family protein n=1 Tax=Marinobacter sp. TaxID=50741 RepID=UPI0034A45C71